MLDVKGHFTEEEVARCADAISHGSYLELPSALREHLANCDSCADEVSSVVELVRAFEPDEKKTKQPIRLWFAITVGVAASIILFIAGYFYWNSTSINSSNASYQVAIADTAMQIQSQKNLVKDSSNLSPKESKRTDKSIITPIRKEILACYQPNDALEKLSRNFTNAYRGEDVSVVSPIEIAVPPSDSIQWKNPNQEDLTVEMFNNKGESIQSIKSSMNGIKIPKLERGLYYWKLINKESDLLFCGKITVQE